jgi:hypothetical protein
VGQDNGRLEVTITNAFEGGGDPAAFAHSERKGAGKRIKRMLEKTDIYSEGEPVGRGAGSG